MARRNKKEEELTLKEKLHLLYGNGNWKTHGVNRIGLPGVELHDGPLGLVKYEGDGDMSKATPIQSICFPAPVALSSTFDTDLVHEVGETMGRICRDNNTRLLLAPGMNIKRNPLCGRNFEYYSEDPLLSGKMGAAFVEGIQSQGVGACIKHFACNNQESYRMVNDSIVDKRALHEIYLKPFEIAIKEAKPWAVMSSYNKVNGTYASDNDYLLLDTLKGAWNYDGVVMSDWGGTNDYIRSHNHGLDLEMPCFQSRRSALKKAIYRGVLSEAMVDDSARRMVKLLKRCNGNIRHHTCYAQDAHEFAVKVAADSFVLLENDGVLPLKTLKQTAIIGELARTPNYGGGGSSRMNPYQLDSFYNSAVIWHGENSVFFSPGYRLDGEEDASLSIDAVDMAARAGRVILFLGQTGSGESEGYDRSSLQLPESQIALFNAIYEVNQNIIVVLNVGAPVELPFKDKAKAILLSHFPGEGGGEAIYRVLMGQVCPSGRLSETWPTRAYTVPSFGFYPGTENVSLYRESIYVGYRYYTTAKIPVNYPFGYGLSYAKFKFGAPVLSTKKLNKGEILDVAVKVENISSIEAKTVVQIYQAPPKGNAFKPLRTLLGFRKVNLAPGQSSVVHIDVPYLSFSHYDLEDDHFKVEAGDYLIQVCDDCESVKAEASIHIESEDKVASLRLKVPSYYNLPSDGFIQYDNDFEYLIGHRIPVERNRDEGPYDLNSTFSNIRHTFIGRIIAKQAKARFGGSPNAKMMEVGFLESPIRNISMAGINSRYAQVIVDMANSHYLAAIRHLLFGKRIKK